MTTSFDPALLRRLIDDGELLAAYDTAMSMEAPGGDIVAAAHLDYLRALALARAGATSRAETAVVEMQRRDGLPLALCEDIAALWARLAKDRALALRGEARIAALGDAARRYEDAAQRYDRPFAAVNAASMWLLYGNPERARMFARRALEATDDASDDYWNLATRGEALIVLGDLEGAAHALRRAGDVERSGGTRASTRRQLGELCRHLGLSDSLLAPLANPAVVHFGGHMQATLSPRTGDIEAELTDHIRAWLAENSVGDAYGALAFGADIAFAEALLEHGARLHVVLPVDVAQFVELSVRPGGSKWVGRFERCLDMADSVEITFEGRYDNDDALFAYASDIAMGHAVTRAHWLEAPALQLMVWDGEPADQVAGTARDIAVWRDAGRTTTVFPVARRARRSSDHVSSAERRVGVALFGDFAGFSALRDDQYAPFVEHVLGALAAVIDDYGGAVLQRNTWGDGILLMMGDVDVAADLALAMQERLAELPMEDLGLPTTMRLRLSAHVGPVTLVVDPITKAYTLVGRSLTRAARIEPRTPPGEVYVSGALAALLALRPARRVVTEYVGRLTTAKDFETLPMYVLRRS